MVQIVKIINVIGNDTPTHPIHNPKAILETIVTHKACNVQKHYLCCNSHIRFNKDLFTVR